MAKGAHLTQEIKGFIGAIHVRYPDYGPTKIREELLKGMKERGLDRNFGPDWPGLSAVQKVYTEIRKNEWQRGRDPLNTPFSLGVVFIHDIPADAIPILLEIHHRRPMTIRQARWAAKLYITAHKYGYASIGDEPTLLHNLAATYALREEACELTEGVGEPCDTADLDKLFLMPVTDKEEAIDLIKSITVKAFGFLLEKRKGKEGGTG